MKNTMFAIMILTPLFLSGCGYKQPPDTDVTSSAKYNFAPFAGTVWKTKVKVALADVKRYNGWHEATLLPPDAFDPTHPKYRPPPDLEELISVLPIGTRLRIERLMKDNGNWGGVQVTASLEDGRVVYLLDDFLAKNRFLWPGDSDSKEWGVNPDMLEKAE
jgi:hypothetical protein